MRDVLLKILAAVEALAPAAETTPAAASDSRGTAVEETKTAEPAEEPAPETTKKRSVSK